MQGCRSVLKSGVELDGSFKSKSGSPFEGSKNKKEIGKKCTWTNYTLILL